MKKLLKWRKECKGIYFSELGVINFEVCTDNSSFDTKKWIAHWFNEKDMLNDKKTECFNYFKDAKQWCENEAIEKKEEQPK